MKTEESESEKCGGQKKKSEKDNAYFVKKALEENYGIFMIIGGMYMGWKAIPVFYMLNTGAHVIFCAYTAYLCIDDLGTMSEAVHFTVLLGTACVSMINSLFYRKQLDDLLNAMGRGFYDYEDTLDDECKIEIEKLHKDAKSRKKFYTIIFVAGVTLAGAAIAVVRPLLELFLLDEIVITDDGVNRFTPVDCWYPLDPSVFWQSCLCIFLQYLVVAMTPAIIFGTDITFLCMAEDFCVQLNIIGLTFLRSKERALNMMKTKEKNGYKAKKFQEMLELCVKHSIKHHSLIISLFQTFRSLNYIVLLWFTVGSSFLLCLSGLIFVSDKVNALSKVTFLMFLTLETIHALIFCWYGEQIQTKSTELGQCVYNSSWIENSHTMKYYIIIIQARCFIPLRLSAGGYMDVNLNTYGNVLSSSYSYFNLLRAVN